MPVWDPKKPSGGVHARPGSDGDWEGEYCEWSAPASEGFSADCANGGYEIADEGFGPKSFSPLGAEISVMLDRHHKSLTEHLDGWMERQEEVLERLVAEQTRGAGRGSMFDVAPMMSYSLSQRPAPMDPASAAFTRAQMQKQQLRESGESACSGLPMPPDVSPNKNSELMNDGFAVKSRGFSEDGSGQSIHSHELKNITVAARTTGNGAGARDRSSTCSSRDSFQIKRVKSNNSADVIASGFNRLVASTSHRKSNRASAVRPSINRLDSTAFDPNSVDNMRKSVALTLGKNADQIAARNSKIVMSQVYREPTRCDECRESLAPFVQSFWFELFFAAAIITNSIIVGVQVQISAEDPRKENSAIFIIIQHCYAFLFMLELMVRMFVDGVRGFLCSDQWMWNYLDVVIVTSSLLEVVVDIVHLAKGAEKGEEAGGGKMSNIRIVRIIRIARLMRVFRIIRIVRFIRALRTLVYSIICTLKSLIWAMLLLVMIMYVFGILFTQATSDYFDANGLLHLINPDVSEDCSEDPVCFAANLLFNYWGSLPRSMFTLLKAISGGVSWDIVVEPLSSVGWFWVMLFNAFILFVYFAVLNVVTGVFCQSAIESAQHDQDMLIQEQIQNKQRYVDQVKTLFKNIDEDSSGYITITEFERHLEDENVRAYFASMELDTTDAWTLFKLIDMDEAHIIDIEEFVMGCLRLKGPAKSIDIAKLMYENKFMMKRMAYFIKFSEAQFTALLNPYYAGPEGESALGSDQGSTVVGRGLRASAPASAMGSLDSKFSASELPRTLWEGHVQM